MPPWSEFALALTAFLGSHALPARPRLRGRLVALLGERVYLLLYGAVSLGLLAWLIAAAGRAPYVALWDFAPWQLWAPNLAMPLVCLLVAYGLGAANPLSFGGRRAVARDPSAFDPTAPGIAGVARHPLLWALALWSASHLLPNGDLAHVLLFGGFTLFALLGMGLIDRRLRRRLGTETWEALARRTSLLPFAALLDGRWRPRRLRLAPLRLAAALVLYLTLLLGHPAVIGVSPLPPL